MIRFRRLDAYNYVIEHQRTIPDTIEGGPNRGKPHPRAGEKEWVVDTYHNRLDWMVKRALEDGIGGNSLKEFAASLEQAKKDVLDALHEAVRTNALSMYAYNEKMAVRSSQALKTRKKNKALKEAGR